MQTIHNAAVASDLKPAGALAQSDVVRQFLIFGLDGQEYAIAIGKVQEIRSYEPVTRIANAPDYILGVINLRGSIVPIVDLRKRLGVSQAGYTASTVVIVLNLADFVVGMVVDSVADVVDLVPGQIKPAPAMQAAIDTGFLLGVGTLDERMLIIVDIDGLMTGAGTGMMQQVTETAMS